MKQKTLKKECTISGIGLHTGCKVDLIFKPAEINAGISFVRVDLQSCPVLKADISNVQIDTHELRCTSLGKNDVVVYTAEHLMSVLFGLGIHNLIIEINGEEVPGMDGSGVDFFNIFKKAGILEQDAEVKPFAVTEPIGIKENNSSLCIYPSDEFKISYMLDYEHKRLKSQFVEFTIDEKIFEKEILTCRTFCLESEAEELKSAGLGKGANFKNTLVVSDDGIKENEVRFFDEFARHKILDLIGDLYLLGVPLKGHIFAVRSGHSLNIQLLKSIVKQKEAFEAKSKIKTYNFGDKKEIDVQGIMDILPHRYPFLLVDRVVEIEKGKKAVGIKNVTINEQFFEGHFPQAPVMPGVLVVEAMAQTSGVMLLAGRPFENKLFFFMAANGVKFRKIVSPGDQLLMEVELIKDRGRVAQIKGITRVEDKVVAEAVMTFTVADAP